MHRFFLIQHRYRSLEKWSQNLEIEKTEPRLKFVVGPGRTVFDVVETGVWTRGVQQW